MKVLHVIPSLSPKHGGPSVALPLMARSLVERGIEVDVATTDDDGPGLRMDVPQGKRVDRGGWGVYHFRKQTEFYKYSAPLNRWLAQHVRDYDVVHLHALFSWSSTCAARHARRSGVPYVVRPLGVLNRWGMENRRRWLKRMSFRWVEQPIVQGAAAMHYTSRAEQTEAEQAGARGRAVVIPIGIDTGAFAELPSAEMFYEQFPQARGKRMVLFLSRLDQKKGLDLLLPAFAHLHARNPNALLVIAGGGVPEFVAGLRRLAEQLGICSSIVWAGFLAGTPKLAAFAAASVFVLPSYSENFGIALVEALAAGIPCVTTTGVAVSEDLASHHAGIVTPPEIAAIADALDRLLNERELRDRCSRQARALALERYSIEAMGQGLASLCTSLAAPLKSR